jgi:Acetyltransferase (GNAT) domain
LAAIGASSRISTRCGRCDVGVRHTQSVEEDIATQSPPQTLSRINPLDTPNWDAGLATCPGASFFHSSAWARVLHDTYGLTPVYSTLGDPGHPQALLPIMEVASWLTGSRGVSLPFTDECAPLCREATSWERLWSEALGYARIRSWRYLELRGGRSWLGNVPVSTSFWGHRLDLRAGEAALFAGVDSARRRAVRKAEQSGLSVEFSESPEAVREFYRLLCITRKRHGIPPQPFAFFSNIQRHILAQNHGWIGLARHGGVVVAGAIFFHSGTTALYKFGASDERFQHLRGNNLVMWSAIKRYAGEGFVALDFGRTSLDNEGLRRFKLGWGTTEYPIDYVRYNLRAERWTVAKDKSSGWHNRVFRRLPIPLARLIGRVLYRHIG